MWKEVLNFSLKNGGTLTATQANIWQGSLTIEQSVSADDTFELGSTHIGQMTVTLADLQVSQIQDATFSLSTEGHLILDGERVPYQTVYANVDFTDAVVVVYMAQDDDTLTQMGVYNVVQTTRDDGIISITAYDNMNTLSEPYTTSLTFPSTYGAMANEITGQLLTFDGSSTAVAEKPEAEDLTKREVLGYIAQACGYNVLCNPQGYFQFVRYNLSGFSTQGQYHEISSLYSFHHSQYPVVITGVKVIVTDEEMTTDPDTGDTVAEIVTHEYTAGTDTYQLVIEENPLITTANGQSVSDALYALYGNVEFYTGDVSHLSDLSIKASDIMKVTDRHNNTFPMLVSRTVISTGSAQNTSSYAEEPSRKIVTQPSQMSRIQNSVRQAAIDAQNGRRIASNTNQYFWHTETGSDTGAHITEIPREDFLDDPTNGGGNLLARSNGVAVRDGLTELAQFTASGAMFYDGTSRIPTAQFRPDKAIIGKDGFTNVEISTDGIEAMGESSNIYFAVRRTGSTVPLPRSMRDIETISDDMGTLQTFIMGKTAGDADHWIVSYTMLYEPNVESYIILSRDAFTHGQSRTISHATTVEGVDFAYDVNYHADNDTIATSFQVQGVVGNYTYIVSEVQYTITSAAPSYRFGYLNEDVQLGVYAFAEGWETEATGDYSHASGVGSKAQAYASSAHNLYTTASGKWQTVVGKYNDEDENNEYGFIVGNGVSGSPSNAMTVDWQGNVVAQGKMQAGAVQSFTPTWETGHEPAASHCVVSAGICSIFYQGPVTTHATNTLLGTLPVGARPVRNIFCPFVKANIAYGTIRIETTGEIYVGFISSTTASNRIYFNCSYPVV